MLHCSKHYKMGWGTNQQNEHPMSHWHMFSIGDLDCDQCDIDKV